MRIFVTGGTGFIGLHVIKKLQSEKHQVLILTREKSLHAYETVQGNMSDVHKWKKKVKQFKPEATIHLAWEGLPDYDVDQSIKNLKYGLDLFLFLSEIGCKKIISVGSCWEYGERNGKITENAALKPYNPFAASKSALFLIGSEIAKENAMEFFHLRPFFVYGPGQRKTSLIPHLITSFQRGAKPFIKTPRASHDFVYVEDVADAIVSFLQEAKESGAYNVGAGILTRVLEVQSVIEKHNYIKIFKNKKKGLYADIRKITRETGWKPTTSIEQGIKKTISYYE